MLKALPNSLEQSLAEQGVNSYNIGISIRFRGVLQSAVLLGIAIAIMFYFTGVTSSLFLAITIAISTLCIIWSLYSISASMNIQADTVTRVLVHYFESAKNNNDET
jgi:hypothetical protein